MGQLRMAIPYTRRQIRKRQLTPLTWNILSWKRRLRKHHLDATRRRKFGILRELLLTWRGLCRQTQRPTYPYERWLRFLDVKTALLEYHLWMIQPILRQMIADDDNHYYQQLATRAARVDNEDGLQGLWKELRGTLPKWRTRRAMQKHDIDDELCAHFASLEAGTVTSFGDLYNNCIRYQNQSVQLAELPQQCQLTDLPSLFEIEQVCRKTTPVRAPGPDQVIPEV